MSSKGNHTVLNRIKNKSDQCKISDLTKACDCLDNLQISIYHISQEKFIYSNAALKKIIGVKASKIINQNWDFWFDLVIKDELLAVKNKINNFLSMPYFKAPYVLKYHIRDHSGRLILLRHELLLHYLQGNLLAINYFFDITEKEKIEAYFNRQSTNKNAYKQKKLISPREEEVLKLVADGFSSKQIADKLFISNHTAITHRKNLIEKFKVKNTAQLIKRISKHIELW
ncbi:response regulator transcription factor [Gelatiniphilus marinus]|uniref:Response regulator transcription factor n=1 Tax=Gelatiniphilus marinus TaxID=1759464 RepID=A0ABW5JQ62_9FLAO